MKIEAGKYYRTRDGKKAGPMRLNPEPVSANWHWVTPVRPYSDNNPFAPYVPAWREDGMFQAHSHHTMDLVAEWQDEPAGPVVTETVKRIKPGVYGAVTVHQGPTDTYGSCAYIEMRSFWLSAGELREAAKTLTDIADALDTSRLSEHSDDGFDQWLRGEALLAILRSVCERDCKGCDWDRNDDAMLECKTCGKVVDE